MRSSREMKEINLAQTNEKSKRHLLLRFHISGHLFRFFGIALLDIVEPGQQIGEFMADKREKV